MVKEARYLDRLVTGLLLALVSYRTIRQHINLLVMFDKPCQKMKVD